MWDHKRDLELWEGIARDAHSRHSQRGSAYVQALTSVEHFAHKHVAERAQGGQRVLEIGVGGGEHLVYRHSTTGSERYVGLDLSPAYAEICRAKFGIEVVVGDAAAMPFADASFDCVIAMSVLEHVERLDTVLGEIARVLQPGGRMLAAIPTNGSLAVNAFKTIVTYPTLRRRGIRRADLVWHHLNVNCFRRVQSEVMRRFEVERQTAKPVGFLPWWLSPLWVFECRKQA